MTKKTILTTIIVSMVIAIISLFNISLFPPKISLQEIQEVKADGESWYSTGGTWNYRKKITINNNQVVDVDTPSATYEHFPILISTTGLSNIKENGVDIRFTMANGITEIPREIESYSSGNLEAWVKLTLTKDDGDAINDNDVIYMYYGNASADEPLASSEFGSDNVWDNNFVMVQHMEESDIDGGSGDIKDSTSYGNNGTTSGMDGSDQVTGKVDGSLDFDATDDKINVGSGASLDNLSALSISVWAKANSTGQAGQGYFIQKGAWGGANGWRFQKGISSNTVYFVMDYSTTDLRIYANSGSLTIGELIHWYVIWDGTANAQNAYIYKNGIDVSGSRTNGVGNFLDDSYYSALIGNTTSNNRTFDGILDEVRISNTVRSAEWIKTEYNNQNNSTTFLTFGSLETSLACLNIGGVCRDNACSEYLDCASLSGNCDTNNCCIGSCTTDIEFPTTPTNFSAMAVSTSQIDLSWTASTDNGGVEGYNIYRCTGSSCIPTIIINTSSTNSYSDTGLSQNILYTYAVSAYDAVPLESAKSSFAQVTIESIVPANITNLFISSCADNSCNLTWTAPGDDDNAGTATAYDIRYSTLNITEDNWDSIMQVTNESNPQTAGTTETHTATGLNPGTNYYFAIKTKDEVLNESGLSNIVNATTGGIISGILTYPIISTNDDSRFMTDSGYLSNLSVEYLDYLRDPYMRFQVDIPKNTTITSAVIKLVPVSQKNTDDSDIKIHLINSDNCPIFTGVDRYANTSTYIDYLINGATWDSKINSIENPYEITGLQSLVQAYIDRSGYDYRQYIGFHFAQTGDFDFKTFYSSNKGLDYYPELVVSYTGGDTVVSEVYMSEPHVKIKQKLYCQLINTKEGDKLIVTVDGIEQVNRTLSSYTKGEEIVTVDYTGLTAGDHSLVIQVKNSAGVSYPANFTKNWTTLHNGIPKVGINENNTICLNGTPFFPITVFMFNKYSFDTSPLSPVINSVMVEGYYDTHTVETWKDYLNRINNKGWYAIGPGSWDGFNGRDSDINKLQNYIQEAKDYNSMLIWHWDDEPNIGGVDGHNPATVMKNWLDLTHKNDTNHPVSITYSTYESNSTKQYYYLYNENIFNGNKTAVHDIVTVAYYPCEYANYTATSIEEYLLMLDQTIEWNGDLFPLHTFIESQDLHDNYGSSKSSTGNPYLNVSNINGSFQAGEVIIASSGGTGTIPNEHDGVTIDSFVRPEYGIIILENKAGVFNPNDTLTGQTSGATATYLSLISNLPLGWPKNYEWTPGPTPAQLKNEIWTSIIHGTKAISYFQMFTKTPAENIAVMQDFKDQMKDGLDQIVLSGDPTTTTTLSETGAGRIDHMTKDYNGTTYIFAARVKKETGDNPGNETATFTVSGLTAGTNIAVYEEGRSITAGSGTFQDTFAENEVHIYEIGGVVPPDITPPVASVSINLNNKITNSQTTNLSTPASDLSGVTEMKISNTNDFSTAVTCAYTTVKEWILTAGDELKTVYAWFKDSVGNWTDESNPKIDTIRLDTAVPIISNILTSNITYNSVTISFNTNENTTSYVEYGQDTSYGSQTKINTALLKNYELLISNLSDNTTYNFRITSRDYASNTSSSTNQTFTTTQSATPDTTTPSDITSLTASNITQTSASLNWTSPGDDNNIGIASIYDLRYSTSNITELNFNNVTQLSGEPNPAVAGTNQSMIAVGLSPNTTYYFAIKTTDNASNVSNLSNIISITTLSESTPPPTPPSEEGGGTGGGGSYTDTTPPSNPAEFIAIPAESQITLLWNNPTNSDFVRVKILKKEGEAPLTHNDETAEVIYEGTNEEYTDINLDNNITYHYAIFAYDQKPNYSKILSISSQPIAGKTTIEIPNQELTYPNGTLIKTIESFKVYIVIDNKKKWIPTPEVFETLGYQWGKITITTKTNLNKIPNYEDNLIRAINDYKVYLVVNGISRHLPNPEIFLDYGFSWDDVIDVPQATINQYQRAYLIRESRQGKIYYLRSDGIKKHIPNAEVFASYNNNWNDVQVISKKEMDSYVESSLIQLEGDNGIYLVEGGMKRYISSAEIFNKHQFNWERVVKVNETEFNCYRTGNTVK